MFGDGRRVRAGRGHWSHNQEIGDMFLYQTGKKRECVEKKKREKYNNGSKKNKSITNKQTLSLPIFFSNSGFKTNCSKKKSRINEYTIILIMPSVLNAFINCY